MRSFFDQSIFIFNSVNNIVYVLIHNNSILDILWFVIGVWYLFLSLCNGTSTFFANSKCVFQNRNKGCGLAENVFGNHGFQEFEAEQ